MEGENEEKEEKEEIENLENFHPVFHSAHRKHDLIWKARLCEEHADREGGSQ